MGRTPVFFRFQGRIPRRIFWIGLTALLAAAVIAVYLLSYLFEQIIPDRPSDSLVIYGRLAILMVVWIPAFYSILAVLVKRLHDRDKSGRWVVILVAAGFLPLIAIVGFLVGPGAFLLEPSPYLQILDSVSLAIALWFFVELGFLKGTKGPNRFGADPLAPPGAYSDN